MLCMSLPVSCRHNVFRSDQFSSHPWIGVFIGQSPQCRGQAKQPHGFITHYSLGNNRTNFPYGFLVFPDLSIYRTEMSPTEVHRGIFQKKVDTELKGVK